MEGRRTPVTGSFDQVGNRTDHGGTYTTGNRITQFNGCTYTTDAEGNVTSRTGTGCVWASFFWWTIEGQLDSVQTGATGIKYLYDAAGRLVLKRVNGVAQAVFLWQGDNLLAELDGTATVKRAEYSYYPGLDNLHAVVINGERLYAHADGLGNVIALTDEAQVVRRQYGYDDWGNSGGTSGTLALPDADRARWKGALWMGPELDLYYMRNRWYEPGTGRFLSEDPKGLAGGINPAIFAGDNPVTYRDPKGLECEVIKFPLTDPKTGELTGEIGESLWCTDITPGDVQAIADYLGGETGQAAFSFFTGLLAGGRGGVKAGFGQEAFGFLYNKAWKGCTQEHIQAFGPVSTPFGLPPGEGFFAADRKEVKSFGKLFGKRVVAKIGVYIGKYYGPTASSGPVPVKRDAKAEIICDGGYGFFRAF